MNREVWEIDIHRIRCNCRLMYDEDVILRLGADIKLRGLLEPIVVELVESWFRIIDGEKRCRACRKIGLNRVKALILELP